MTDLSYHEQRDKLDIRIRAHKLFANIDIDDFIEEFLSRAPRRAILDIGCGNGHHLGMYLRHVGPKGRVLGIDREAGLVETARASYADAPNVEVLVGSMDDPLPADDASFDLAFSNFAIYNARDPRSTLLEARRVLKPGGEVVLIGPTRRNAYEIYEYNARLTGTAIDPITLVRTDRLRQEILPIARDVFGSVREEIVNSFLTFPTADDFLAYFKATMLYEEGAEKLGVTDDAMRRALPADRDIVLSKEMLVLIGKRDDDR
jgi:ubiquinone/menaquinone biosynthesis C-methylase UbiE